MLQTGMTHTASVEVNDANTAIALGSGDLPVFATPAMVALMEQAAAQGVAPYLDGGSTSVGTRVDTSHVRGTAVGGRVTATAVLTVVEGRQLEFRVEARDGDGNLLGEGTHTRFVVDREKFMSRL